MYSEHFEATHRCLSKPVSLERAGIMLKTEGFPLQAEQIELVEREYQKTAEYYSEFRDRKSVV